MPAMRACGAERSGATAADVVGTGVAVGAGGGGGGGGGAGAGAGRPGTVVPQKPSAPSVTHTAASSRTEPPLVAVSVTGPRSASVSCAVPSAPVVAVAPPPLTVAPADGVAVPSAAWSVTVTVNGSPGAAVAGA